MTKVTYKIMNSIWGLWFQRVSLRECGSRHAGMMLEQELRAYTERESFLRLVWAFESSKSTPSDMSPSTGPYFLNLPK